MDAFSYLTVLFSIILGLAIQQILQGVRVWVLARDRVAFHAPTAIWCGLLLLIDVQSWWATFGLRDHSEWSFGVFLLLIAHVSVLYMVSGLTLPDFPSGERIDLEEHFLRQRGWFYGLIILAVLLSVLKDVVLDGQLPEARNLGFHGLFAALALTGIVSRRPWAQLAVSLAVAAAVAAYVILLFPRLQ